MWGAISLVQSTTFFAIIIKHHYFTECQLCYFEEDNFFFYYNQMFFRELIIQPFKIFYYRSLDLANLDQCRFSLRMNQQKIDYQDPRRKWVDVIPFRTFFLQINSSRRKKSPYKSTFLSLNFTFYLKPSYNLEDLMFVYFYFIHILCCQTVQIHFLLVNIL